MSTTFAVRQAKRQRRPLKISLEGLSGSGKTYTAIRMAFDMKRHGIGKRIVVADSENESASLYEGIEIDGERWEYEVCPIPPEARNPAGYADVYEYLVGQGFDIIILDSMSHAWHGALDMVDAYSAKNKGDKFGGWAKVTPTQRRMFDLITDPHAHLIATMRVKGDYERIDDNGRSKIKKVGMKVDQREGAEYEFDCVIRMEPGDHAAHVEKVRGCTAMDDKTTTAPGPSFWKPLFQWWLSAEAAPPPPPRVTTPAPATNGNGVSPVAIPMVEYEKMLLEESDLNGLGRTWMTVPSQYQKALLPLKDRLKEQFGFEKLMHSRGKTYSDCAAWLANNVIPGVPVDSEWPDWNQGERDAIIRKLQEG